MASRKRKGTCLPVYPHSGRKLPFPETPSRCPMTRIGVISPPPKPVTGMGSLWLAKNSWNLLMELSHLKEVVFEQIQALPGRCEWIFGRQPTVSAIVPLCVIYILRIFYNILWALSAIGSLLWLFFSKSLLHFLCSLPSAPLSALLLRALGVSVCTCLQCHWVFSQGRACCHTLPLWLLVTITMFFNLKWGGLRQRIPSFFLIYWCQKPY